MKKPSFKAKRRGTCPGSYALSDAFRWRLIPDSGHLFPVHTLKFPIKVGWTIKPDLHHFHKWSDCTKSYRVNMGLLNKLQNNITKLFPLISTNIRKYLRISLKIRKKRKKGRKGVTWAIISLKKCKLNKGSTDLCEFVLGYLIKLYWVHFFYNWL